jgi:SAM-dependent methyltransferase
LSDERHCAPAAERNKGPILEVLRSVLPSAGLVLEIASGTGQHAAFFAEALPALEWQPSETDAEALPSISAWSRGLANVRAPLVLDVRVRPWPVDRADAIVCINMIHIAPWQAALALLQGAGELLPARGVLVLYGPYRRFGRHTAPSNEAFDASLRERDPQWGVRDIEALAAAASEQGLELEQTIAMPANNFSLVLRRGACL